jgi:hypothetical protein
VQPLFETIERLEENIKGIEKQLRVIAEGDRMVELLMTIPGCGEICAWTIRAYTDDIKRFANPKKYASFAGLAPWVQNSNETIHHGSITKRGPKELRTAMVQVVMGLRRMKEKTFSWRFMQRYEAMKKSKGSGRAIIATARKIAVVIWNMLTENVEFDIGLMVDRKLANKAESMSGMVGIVEQALNEAQEKPVIIEVVKRNEDVKKTVKISGVAREKRKKVG